MIDQVVVCEYSLKLTNQSPALPRSHSLVLGTKVCPFYHENTAFDNLLLEVPYSDGKAVMCMKLFPHKHFGNRAIQIKSQQKCIKCMLCARHWECKDEKAESLLSQCLYSSVCVGRLRWG